MPQSTAALRQKAEALRVLRNPQNACSTKAAQPARPVWAKKPHTTTHGTCVALELRTTGLWVLVQKDGQEAWAPAQRILSPEASRAWAREGFG